MTSYQERAVAFECGGNTLIGILSQPDAPARRGVLIVVGGPQYRAGSHRQFTLLARALAANGVPALRFDYGGMGDSEGAPKTFEAVQKDIRRAVDLMVAESAGLKEVVVWGLCDAASAALFYGHTDARIAGLVLVNPWVRTAEGLAQAQLQHYYGARLRDPELWRKIGRGEFNFKSAAAALARTAGKALAAKLGTDRARPRERPGCGIAPLPERMRDGLARFRGRVMLILSGDDLTAREFETLVNSSKDWRALLSGPQVTRRDLPQANHTFSRRDWRDQVAGWTTGWVKSW